MCIFVILAYYAITKVVFQWEKITFMSTWICVLSIHNRKLFTTCKLFWFYLTSYYMLKLSRTNTCLSLMHKIFISACLAHHRYLDIIIHLCRSLIYFWKLYYTQRRLTTNNFPNRVNIVEFGTQRFSDFCIRQWSHIDHRGCMCNIIIT
jgi:hypothetical protein